LVVSLPLSGIAEEESEDRADHALVDEPGLCSGHGMVVAGGENAGPHSAGGRATPASASCLAEQSSLSRRSRRRLDRRAPDGSLRATAPSARGALGLRAASAGPELDTAVRTSRELIRLAPFREPGHAQLMKALAAHGNLAEAVLAYEELRVLLREELGLDPAPELRALHADRWSPSSIQSMRLGRRRT
jgi:hypothetical protein